MISSTTNSVNLATAGRLKQKISLLKEKFQYDISELQNQMAAVKKKQAKMYGAY